ncbi:hypothetical protein BDZ94DRAFT_1313887 [Collybia nuda]|uniref:WD40 repeat-like protein n=1 Tax=Collybia nuda TaxID=64659 RepID=A0A9P5XVW0_9AGAR|nr:hypothetical protein BDZ94DRAFT_1313887 [Collybia nuda]
MAFNFNTTSLSSLQKKLDNFIVDDEAQEADHENQYEYFLGILHDVCKLVQESDGFAPDFEDITLEADRPRSKDSTHWTKRRTTQTPTSLAQINEAPPLTSRLSRFRGDVAVSASSDTPLANTIYEARCEITSNNIPSPIGLHRSPDDALLTLLSAGRYKNCTPTMQCFIPNEEDPFGTRREVFLPLEDLAYNATIDAGRKLVFVGDSERVKSFAWGAPGIGGEEYARMRAVHTLASHEWSGPMGLLSGGRLARGGEGSVGVWNIDALQTRGPKGKTRIGGKFDTEATWRDDPEAIEASAGSVADAVIKLEESDFSIARWHAHPAAPGVMLCTTRPYDTQNYSCLAIDLEHGGKTGARYLGHGGEVEQYYTSEGDPNVFLTACSDGYARLYDVRHPLPVLTLDSGNRTEGCPAAVLVHPDVIPSAYSFAPELPSRAEQKEQIKMWDIRAKSVVYELSTMNNSVVGMEWDAGQNVLFAATECKNMGRMGCTTEYRRAMIPRDQELGYEEKLESPPKQRDGGGDDDEEEEEDSEGEDMEDDDDVEDEEYQGRFWPKNANHAESHFGYLFDAGEHMLCSYAFKEHPDATVLPPYGQATLHSYHWY